MESEGRGRRSEIRSQKTFLVGSGKQVTNR